MTNDRLDRPYVEQSIIAMFLSIRKESSVDGLSFKRVAYASAGAVCFEELGPGFCLCEVETSTQISLSDQVSLCFRARQCDPFSVPVLVRAGFSDNALDVVAISNSIIKAFETHDSYAFAASISISCFVPHFTERVSVGYWEQLWWRHTCDRRR
jgi:hypothetical protein